MPCWVIGITECVRHARDLADTFGYTPERIVSKGRRAALIHHFTQPPFAIRASGQRTIHIVGIGDVFSRRGGDDLCEALQWIIAVS